MNVGHGMQHMPRRGTPEVAQRTCEKFPESGGVVVEDLPVARNYWLQHV